MGRPKEKEIKRFSNYADIVPYREEYAVYNKINGKLVLMESENIRKDTEGNWFCISGDAETQEYLERNLFFAKDGYVQNIIRENDKLIEDYNDVRIVISTTEACNCDCSYCYQRNWTRADLISEEEYRKWILEYIYKIILLAEDGGKLTIKYFGGEPLLKIEFILSINREIERIIKLCRKKIYVRYEMDSNCTLLTREILEQFDNLSIATTLSLPDDHNFLRSNSFQKVMKSLSSVSDLLELPQYNLNIGYNVHHGNISEFNAFLHFLKDTGISCQVYVTNIVNHEGSTFKNLLSDEEFERQYCSSIIPCLIQHGYNVDILPDYGLKRKCDGMNIVNRKFYSNGTQELCSFFPKRDKKAPGDYPSPAAPHPYLQPLPEQCIRCYDFPYCGGARPCVDCIGKYEYAEAMKRRICLYLDLYFRT